MIYLTWESNLYKSVNGEFLTTLPMYQNVFVINETGDYYKVYVDGIVGYINKTNTKEITTNCAVVDLGRQIIKIYYGTNEVYRAHIISGRKDMPSDMGYYTIGHHMRDYQLTPDHMVSFWMQYNGNEGLHDASWQTKKNFNEVCTNAYERYGNGTARTYPNSHGSHGCINLKYEDATVIFDLLKNNDHVLVIGPNNLIKDNLLSKNRIKIDELLDLKYQLERASQEKIDFNNKIKIKKLG